MYFRYGLENQEKAFGTVVRWESGKGILLIDNFGTSPRAETTLREKEVMFRCGNYPVPTDDIAKPVMVGDIYKCLVIETEGGLLALGAVKYDTVEPDWNGQMFGTVIDPPRFTGMVQHWNFEKNFGFIESDFVVDNLFFHKKEVLVPYELLNDPSEAAKTKLKQGDLVTFDAVNTPRGMRAIAVKKFKG